MMKIKIRELFEILIFYAKKLPLVVLKWTMFVGGIPYIEDQTQGWDAMLLPCKISQCYLHVFPNLRRNAIAL